MINSKNVVYYKEQIGDAVYAAAEQAAETAAEGQQDNGRFTVYSERELPPADVRGATGLGDSGRIDAYKRYFYLRRPCNTWPG